MDDKRLTSSRHEVGTEEVDLGESSVGRTIRVQETRKGARPERVVLDSSVLFTAARDWLRWTAEKKGYLTL